MASIQIESVTKRFGSVPVINGVDLAVENGELIVFVGPSGCGKTTLLRMISGLETVTSGDIYIGDRKVNDVPPKDRNIAMVFQNYALYPHMTVADNIAFGLKLRGMPKAERGEAVERVAAMLGLSELLKRRPRELSGGQRQRVAMGRCIVRDPSVFLMDEPLSNLDAKLRNQMRVEIKQLQRDIGKTMIYVTHDQIEAMTLADRIVVLEGGHVAQIGSPDELYTRPANLFVAGFIGTPAMNFIPARRNGGNTLRLADGVEMNLPDARAKKLGDETDLTVGVRPEHIVLSPGEAGENGPEDLIAWSTDVRLHEPMGGESLVHVGLGDERVRVKVGRDEAVSEGESVTAGFRISHAHVFGRASEACLTPAGADAPAH
jgi:multiple sugar transport system ATP-binding protein